MIYEFVKNITCNDALKCQASIKKKLINKFPVLMSKPYESNFHIRIFHENEAHWIIISICDKENKEDILTFKKEITNKNKSYNAILKGKRNKNNVSFGFIAKTETVTNSNMVKVLGKIPSKEQIEKLI